LSILIVNIAVLGERMDTRTILVDLKAELSRLNQAIAALESLDGTATATTPAAKAAPTQAKKRGLTPAGRRRLSAMMKARWAARRKAAVKPAPKATSGHRTMSPAARKKIAEAQRRRWAAIKKAKTA
jgi:hypothetical protein